MMKKLHERVRMLVRMELTEARKNNGQFFHSLHEGHGVIWEELEEAREDVDNITDVFEELMYSIRTDDRGALELMLAHIEKKAALAACEYIQVAAMARKMREGINEDSVHT